MLNLYTWLRVLSAAHTYCRSIVNILTSKQKNSRRDRDCRKSKKTTLDTVNKYLCVCVPMWHSLCRPILNTYRHTFSVVKELMHIQTFVGMCLVFVGVFNLYVYVVLRQYTNVCLRPIYIGTVVWKGSFFVDKCDNVLWGLNWNLVG